MRFIRYFFWFIIILLLGSCNFGKNGDTPTDDEVTFHDPLNPELNFLNEAIEEDNKNGELFFKRARVYFRLGNTVLALQDVNKAIQLDNVKASYYELLANIYQKLGKHNLALNAAKKCEALNGANVRIWILLAKIHLDLNDFVKAENYFKRARAAAPNHADVYVVEGRLIINKGDSTSATPVFLKALQSNPTHEDALVQLAQAYDRISQDDSCMIYLWKGLQFHPKNPFFSYQMGALLEKKSLHVSATRCYLTAVSLDSAYSPAILKLADQSFRKDSIAEALKWYLLLVRYEPHHVLGNLHVAEILYQTGREHASMPYYRKVLLVEPDNTKAKSAYEKLLLLYPTEVSYVASKDTASVIAVDTVKPIIPVTPPAKANVDTTIIKPKKKIPRVKIAVPEINNDVLLEDVPPDAEPLPKANP